MSNRSVEILGIFAILLSCVVLSILVYVPETKVTSALLEILQTFSVATQLFIVFTALMLSVGVLGGVAYGLWWAWQSGTMWYYRRRLMGAEVAKAEREASLVITVAPPGSQVYASEAGKLPITHKPLYLAPGRVNGAAIEPTPQENQRWAFFQLTQNIGKKPDLAAQELPQLQAPLPETVDLTHYLMGSCSVRRMFL